MNRIIRRVTSGLTALAISMLSVNAPLHIVGTNSTVMTASAEETYGDFTYTVNEDSDGEYIVINKYKGSDTEVFIPSKIKGIPVKGLSRLPNKYDDEYNVFAKTNAVNVTIPKGVEYIGYGVFLNCKTIETVKLPDTLESLADHCFSGCSNLKEIVIPGSVKEIYSSTFEQCNSLKSVKIEEGVTGISSDMFRYCGLLTDVVLPDTIKSIGGEAFCKCSSLRTITIPDSVETIGNSVFMGCSSLADVKLPEKITTIPSETFFNCTSLKEITIPYYVESVGKNAFTFKDKNYNYLPLELEIINFGAKLKSIENLPINSNTLQEINVDAKNGFFSSEKGVLYNKNKSQLIKYPVAKDNNNYTVPETVKQINEGAFANNSKIKYIYLGKNVSMVEPTAFQNCSHLDEIYFYNKDCDIYMSKNTINSTAVINGYKDSTAEEYANTFGFAFNEIKEAATTTSTSVTTGNKTTTSTTTTTFTTSRTTSTSTRQTSLTSTNTSSTSTISTISIVTTTSNETDYMLGDVDNNGHIDAKDASMILNDYNKTSVRIDSELDENQKLAADVNKDGKINAVDSTIVLNYYSMMSLGMESKTFDEYVADTYKDKSIVYTKNGGYSDKEISKSTVKPKLNLYMSNAWYLRVGDIVSYDVVVSGTDKKYSSFGFHIYYDSRLELVYDTSYNNTYINSGDAAKNLILLSNRSENENNGMKELFVCGSGYRNHSGNNGTLFSFKLKITSDAYISGNYPVEIRYEEGDLFMNESVDEEGKLMQAYLFTNGISNDNSSIVITTMPTTTTTMTTTTHTASTTTTFQQPTVPLKKGDVTNDNVIDGRDATAVLTYYAQTSTGQSGSFNEYQKQAAEVNDDNVIDGRDATLLLTYYAYTSTGHSMTLDEYISEPSNPTTSTVTTISTITTTTTTTTETTTTTTTSPAWKQLYLNAATSYESSNSGSVYKLINLNGDDIPELYARNSKYGGSLWTIANGEVKQLQKWDNSMAGAISNYSETNHTFVTLSALSELYFEYAIWSLSDNGEVNKEKAFTNNNGKYSVDYISVAQAQYESLMKSEVTSLESVFSTSNDLSISQLRSRLG